MITQALVLADRDGPEFEPLATGLPPALLPIAGKPVIQHCIEDLWEAGIRDVLVAVPAGDRTIERELGNGQRFGLTLRYLDTGGRTWPGAVLAIAGLPIDAPLLVARGDVLRGRSARALVDLGCESDLDVVVGTIGSTPAGIALIKRRCSGVNQLDWSLVRRGERSQGASIIELGDVGFAALDSLTTLFEAGLAAIEGRYAGLVMDGRTQGSSGLSIAARASIARSVHASGIARIGRRADLHDDVEVAGRVEVGDGCVIDEAAQLIDAVVLPGTYVGRGVRLQNAIAHGPWLYRADLDTCQRVEDPLLLAGPAAAIAA